MVRNGKGNLPIIASLGGPLIHFTPAFVVPGSETPAVGNLVDGVVIITHHVIDDTAWPRHRACGTPEHAAPLVRCIASAADAVRLKDEKARQLGHPHKLLSHFNMHFESLKALKNYSSPPYSFSSRYHKALNLNLL